MRTPSWGHHVITPLVAPWGHFGDIIVGASLCHHPLEDTLVAPWGQSWMSLGDTLVAPWGHVEDTIVPPPPWNPLGGTMGTLMDVVPAPLGAPWGHFGDTLWTSWGRCGMWKGRRALVAPWGHFEDIIVGASCHHPLGGTLGTLWGHHRGGIVPSPPWGHFGGTLRRP